MVVLMSGLVAISGNVNALTPQNGHVSYSVFYHNSGSSKDSLASSATVVNVYTLSGIFVTSYTGNHNNVTLPYGEYSFQISPTQTVGYGNTIITNTTKVVVNVNSAYVSVPINISYYNTVKVSITLNDFSTGSADVSFSTLQGFNFLTSSTTNGSLSARVPVGPFTVSVSYGESSYNFYEVATSSTSNMAMSLNGANYYGFVQAPGGSSINNFNISIINGTTGTSPSVSSYQVVPFTGGYFQLTTNYSAADTHLVILAKGYQPMNVNLAKNGLTYTLINGTSNITYNYNLSNNPNYLNLSVGYSISNSTALPFAANSSIGSLYWQIAADHLTSSSQVLMQAIANVSNDYTNDTILVDGSNYKLVGSPAVVKSTLGTSSYMAEVNYTYSGSGLTASYLATNGLKVRVDALGTQYMPGALNYRYNLTYNNSLGALSSPASQVTHFISPVAIKPQSSTGFLTLTFKKVSKPTVTASSITEYWNNMVSTNYVLNSSASNTLFVAPVGKDVNLNLSNAFYNPVTGTDDYLNSLNYSWKTNASIVGGQYTYNSTLMFPTPGAYYVNVSYESASGATNTTNFSVVATYGNVTPAINASYNGKALLSVKDAKNTTYRFYAPLLDSVSFSSSGSFSSVTFKGQTYNISLVTTWGLPGYVSTGQSISYTYKTFNYTNRTPQMGYMNITSITGQKYVNVTLAATVNDTVAPTPVVTIYNSAGKTESNPVAGNVTTFSANTSTDNYYPTSDLKYNWSILYKNGTVAKPSSTTYQIVGNMSFNGTSYIKVKFETLNNMVVSLSATNPSHLTGYDNKTVTMLYSTPRIVVDSVYAPKPLTQGVQSTINITVSNNGSVAASNYTISLYINGKFVTSHNYNETLAAGASRNLSFTFKSPVSGKPDFQFRPYNTSEPSFFSVYNSYSTNLTVKAPSYVAEIVVGIIVVVIILVGVAYSRLGARPQKKAKAISRKDEPRKKLEEPKKKLEDKDSSNKKR